MVLVDKFQYPCRARGMNIGDLKESELALPKIVLTLLTIFRRAI